MSFETLSFDSQERECMTRFRVSRGLTFFRLYNAIKEASVSSAEAHRPKQCRLGWFF